MPLLDTISSGITVFIAKGLQKQAVNICCVLPYNIQLMKLFVTFPIIYKYPYSQLKQCRECNSYDWQLVDI